MNLMPPEVKKKKEVKHELKQNKTESCKRENLHKHQSWNNL